VEEKKYAILPCNGLDKGMGQITRESALKLQEKYPNNKEYLEDMGYMLIDTGEKEKG